MTMTLLRLLTRPVPFAAASLVATAALTQTANYTSIETTTDKPVQLSYHASAHNNCTPGPLPTIRVIEAPKSGTLTARKAVLSADKVAGCPTVRTPAQVIFYRAHAGYAGPDHVRYEVTSENNETATYDVTITVKVPPVQNPPAGDANGQRL
jgi:hypothetical protein